MTPQLVQRHFDYVLGPDQDAQLASIAAGDTITSVLELDSDAPFMCRGRALRVSYDTTNFDQRTLNHVLMRWYGPERKYTSQGFVRQSLLSPYFGQMGNAIPVYPGIYYPPQSEIRVDIKNDGAAAITNLTLYFRGTKLFRPGAVKAYGYPDRFALFSFDYPASNAPTVGDNGGMPLITLPVTTGNPGPVFVFKTKTDADFVLQGLQAGFPQHLDANGNPVLEVFVTLRDEDEKPYSNAPVHVDIIAGNSAFGNVYPAGTSSHIAPVACGPNSPGIVFPEIYIPKNHLFYMNFQRTDAAYAGAATVNFPFNFVGQKVFQK